MADGRYSKLDEKSGCNRILGLWEKLHNPSFNPLEFEGVKKQAGANAFTMSPKIISRAGNLYIRQ